MSNPIHQLKDLLTLDQHDLEALESTLDQEKAALKVRDAAKLDQLSKHKSELISQIETRAKHKAKLLASSGLGIKPGQVELALEKLGDADLLTRWKNSIEKLAQCKDKNLVNGTIISHSLQRTAKIMGIIRGQNSAPKLYGQKGKAQAMSGSHVLGKA